MTHTLPPDVVGLFSHDPPPRAGGARTRRDGLRPIHGLRPGEWFGGEHAYPDVGCSEPGTTVPVHVWLIAREHATACLWPGKRIVVREGATRIGEITVVEVTHPGLDARAATRGVPFTPEALTWPQWQGARGGSRAPYDPRPLIRRIAAAPMDAKGAWQALWENLYHEGEIGLASLLTVPLLAALRSNTGVPDWNIHALASAIEEARLRDGVAQLPGLHFSQYENAISALARLALLDLALDDDPTLVRAALGMVAFARQLPTVGALISGFTEDEDREILRTYRGW